MATGTGKTRTAIALVDLLQRANWVKRTLFLADRISLVKQAAGGVQIPPARQQSGQPDYGEGGRGPGLCEHLSDHVEPDQPARPRGKGRFGPGYFDLVIIDEAHRSVYSKYGAIFEHFDSLLIGLTATPEDEIDRNTYELFSWNRVCRPMSTSWMRR